jgi:putative ABC transport system permease protein
MESFFRNVRYALRNLRKRPVFSLIVVFTLALGIGANTAIFSVVDAVLLAPLPYSAPHKLVVLWAKNEKQNLTQQPVSYPNIVDLKEATHAFERLSVVRGEVFSLTDRDEPERVTGVRVSTNILTLLGVTPALGRNFLPEEEQPAKAAVALLSHRLWERRYAGDPGLLRQAIIIDGKSYTVIGILPPWLKQPGITLGNLSDPDVWIPVVPAASEQNRNFANMRIVARLKLGVTTAEAQAEMDTLAARLEKQYPDSNTNLRFGVVGLREQLTGRVSKALWILLGVVGCVLLIACANVANLFLARAASRQSEIAVRNALGATRPQLIQESLTECVVLSLTGDCDDIVEFGWHPSGRRDRHQPRRPAVHAAGFPADWSCVRYSTGVSILAIATDRGFEGSAERSEEGCIQRRPASTIAERVGGDRNRIGSRARRGRRADDAQFSVGSRNRSGF